MQNIFWKNKASYLECHLKSKHQIHIWFAWYRSANVRVPSRIASVLSTQVCRKTRVWSIASSTKSKNASAAESMWALAFRYNWKYELRYRSCVAQYCMKVVTGDRRIVACTMFLWRLAYVWSNLVLQTKIHAVGYVLADHLLLPNHVFFVVLLRFIRGPLSVNPAGNANILWTARRFFGKVARPVVVRLSLRLQQTGILD